MSKRQLITEIQKIHPQADQKFLIQFDGDSLKEYLQSLATARQTAKRQAIRNRTNERLIAA